jgi:C-terminal processing protease CtpA/Prc
VYKPLIKRETSADSLFRILARITDLLHDAHTNIYTQMGIAGNIYYFNNYPENQIDLNESYFEYYNTGRIFEYGKLKKVNIGYLKIRTFDGENKSFDEIDSLLLALNTTQGLIIDVRSNFGGKISNSKIIASRFADSTRYVGKYRVRNGMKHDDFSDWIDIFLSPANKGTYYNKPIVVLTNRMSYSATEWFILLINSLPKVTTVGDTTGGGSAIPLIRELPNGWLLRISNTQVMLPSGRDFQNTGLYPDVPIWITTEDSEKKTDTILEKAISVLSGL